MITFCDDFVCVCVCVCVLVFLTVYAEHSTNTRPIGGEDGQNAGEEDSHLQFFFFFFDDPEI